MIYLTGSTRPNITYTIHQCARFFNVSKRCHEVGVNHITRYLKEARTKEFIMKPDLKNLQLDLFADANFAGLYSTEDKQDLINMNSHTGVLLNFGKVPII